MSKEKGEFDMGDIGVVTKNILQKRVETPREEKAAPAAMTKEEKPAAAAPAAPAAAAGQPSEQKTEKKPKEKKLDKSELVRTSYYLRKTQMDALKKIAFHTGTDYSDVLRQVVDFGIEKIEKKNPGLLKEPEKKDIF
jgi:hypothetical protein